MPLAMQFPLTQQRQGSFGTEGDAASPPPDEGEGQGGGANKSDDTGPLYTPRGMAARARLSQRSFSGCPLWPLIQCHST